MMKLFCSLLGLLVLFLLAGCMTLADQYNVPEKAAFGVDQYCLNVPKVQRLANREAINAITVYGDIAVTCTGDDSP